jgi:glycosyltransferase involved in cell wall biosynthesis
MNILYICDEYPPGSHGGIGTSVQLLAREMARLGHTVVVAGFYDWGYGGEDAFDDQGVKVYRFRRKFAADWMGNLNDVKVKAIRKLLKMTGLLEWDIKTSMKKYAVFLEQLIQKYKIDIAEVPDWQDYMRFCSSPVYFPALSVPVLIKMNGSLTYFISEAGSTVPEYIYKVDHRLLHTAAAVSGVSKYTADKSAEYLHYSKPIEVLHNGITLPENVQVKEKQQYRVIFTGSILKKKGIFQLAKAWNIVHEQLPQAQLLIFGKGPQDEVKRLLNGTAAKTVTFGNHVPRQELFTYLAESAVAIFPSYAECFALAPMEAMACGTAVIYSWRTSGPELIEHTVSGLLIEPDNIEEIAKNILYLLNNPDMREQIAARGKKEVMDKFDIRIIARKNLVHYAEIINADNR